MEIHSFINKYIDLINKYIELISKKISIILSVIIFIGATAILILLYLTNASMIQNIIQIRGYIITVYGVLVGLLVTYIISKTIQTREERISIFDKCVRYTQKLHKFRAIINKLLTYGFFSHYDVNNFKAKHPDVTYFDIQEVLNVDYTHNEEAKKYHDDKNKIGFEPFYLELSSFIRAKGFDPTIYTEFDKEKYFYSPEILEKWIDNKCGNGFWYYLENRKNEYSKFIHLDKIDSTIKEEILKLSLLIDKERYCDMSFNDKFLIKLGTQVMEEVIPNIYSLQLKLDQGLPRILKRLIQIVVILIVFGIALPIFCSLFEFILGDIISISMFFSICSWTVFSLKNMITEELNTLEP